MKLRRYAAGFLAAVLFVLFSVFPAFAAPHTFGELDAYLVETASDAVLLDAASITPYGTYGSVTNTIDLSQVSVYMTYDDASAGVDHVLKRLNYSVSNGRLYFSGQLDSGDHLIRYTFRISPNSFPAPGTYVFSFDVASDISYDVQSVTIYTEQSIENATTIKKEVRLPASWFSGDVYLDSYEMNVTNISWCSLHVNLPSDNSILNLGGSAAFSFTSVASNPDAPSTAGSDTSTQDWENSISSGLGDISSSLDSLDESLQYISNSQNLIIQGIDNVILHISDQLYAFWDQLYNLIHVPTYSMLQQILQAIQSLNLDITVDLDELTQTLEDLQAEQIANDNQIADDIQNGYDSSGLASSDQKLDAALEDQAEKEDQVMEQISEPLESFTFTNPISQYLDTFLVLGDFLQDLYTASGALKDVINLSFLMGIALMVVGLYRFKGGN